MGDLEKSVNLLYECLEKARKMPVGSISKGRKKVAEGKWTTISDKKKSNNYIMSLKNDLNEIDKIREKITIMEKNKENISDEGKVTLKKMRDMIHKLTAILTDTIDKDGYAMG